MKKTEKKAYCEKLKAFQEKIGCTTNETVPMDFLERMVNDYLNLFVEAYTKRYPKEELEVVRKIVITRLYNAFNPRDNRDHSAKTPEEIPQAVKACEADFTTDIKLAWSFFGESFGSQKVLQDNYRITDKKLPETVTMIKEDERRNEWIYHKIMPGGYPVPLYLELYRGSLKRIIDKYLNSYEGAVAEKANKNN